MKLAFAMIFLLLSPLMLALLARDAEAQYRGGSEHRGALYGRFCSGARRGGPYGAKNPVATTSQANQVIEACFSSGDRPLHAGKIVEMSQYFKVELLDPNGSMVDEVVINKRTGRIRSIY
jgi:hypothetical protein